MSKKEWADKFGEVIKSLEQKKVRRRAEIFARATAEATAEWEKEEILIQAEIDGLISERDDLLSQIEAEKKTEHNGERDTGVGWSEKGNAPR